MEKLKKNKSLKKYFVKTLFIVLSVSILLSSITVIGLLKIRQGIMENRVAYISIIEANDENLSDSETIKVPLKDVSFSQISKKEKVIVGVSTVCIILLPVIYIIAAIYIMYIMFYKRKLKKPLTEVLSGLNNILDNNLDFKLDYYGNDELSSLFQVVEKIKSSLYENNTKMWEIQNNKKILDKSISHDLRTPITVIKGYLEYLKLNISNNKIDQDKTLNIIGDLENATLRIENYINSLNKIQKLEDMELETKKYIVKDFLNEVDNELKMLFQDSKIIYKLENNINEKDITIDKQLVIRVLENLISNSLRYAKKIVKFELDVCNDYLYIIVSDDGKGFDEKTKNEVATTFYKNNDENHYGLGLYICKTLCEKHGGNIKIENGLKGGAKITVNFKIKF